MTILRDETRPANQGIRGIRVVPVLLGLLLVAVVALAVSPGLRHQFAQSFSRQDQGYLEVFFVNEQAARSCPLDEEGRVRLEIGVRSHFDSTRSPAWTVTASPTRGTVQAASSTQQGRVRVRPDRTGVFTATVPIPRTATGAPVPYTVSVTLPGHSERLLLHC